MRRRDIFDLMFTLRGGIGRNHYGLLHEGLFSRAMAGSKLLLETYHNVVCAALDFVCDAPVAPNEDPIPSESRLAFFNETRHSYGRTAFLCSGGAALGFYHVGVVKALMLNGLMPRVLGGSSAGSIVTAIIATRTDEECFRDFFNVKGTDAPGHSGKINTDFFRPLGYNAAGGDDEAVELTSSQDGSFKRAFQLFFPLTLRNLTSVVYDVITGFKRPKDILKSDTRHLESCLRNNIGDFTFQEAFDRTGRILNITVSPQSRSDPPRLLNYLTSPHVLIWSAALASASLPGVFEANRLKVKDADGREIYETTSGMAFQDGSMEADLPMQQLSEMFNINHFIISQANPHAVMFANFGLERSVWAHPLVGYVNSILSFMKNQVCDHFHKYSSFITHCVSKFIATFSTNSTRSFGAIFATCSTFLVVEGSLLCGTPGEIWGLNFSPKNTRDEKPISL
jgi:TAG lipase/steryl ester hydrolase/phospholipase A2/LPA acyltransferase